MKYASFITKKLNLNTPKDFDYKKELEDRF